MRNQTRFVVVANLGSRLRCPETTNQAPCHGGERDGRGSATLANAIEASPPVDLGR
jgi:hypothetical protein